MTWEWSQRKVIVSRDNLILSRFALFSIVAAMCFRQEACQAGSTRYTWSHYPPCAGISTFTCNYTRPPPLLRDVTRSRSLAHQPANLARERLISETAACVLRGRHEGEAEESCFQGAPCPGSECAPGNMIVVVFAVCRSFSLPVCSLSL